MVLAPWPSATATVALTAARATLRAAIGAADDLPDARVDQLGRTAAGTVERYAATAPQDVKDEGAIRLAGWLLGSPAGEQTIAAVGEIRFSNNRRSNPSRNALRLSGAMGILSPWHRPPALVLEDAG